MILKWLKNLNNNIFTLESKKQQNKTSPKAILSSHTALPRERIVKIPMCSVIQKMPNQHLRWSSSRTCSVLLKTKYFFGGKVLCIIQLWIWRQKSRHTLKTLRKMYAYKYQMTYIRLKPFWFCLFVFHKMQDNQRQSLPRAQWVTSSSPLLFFEAGAHIA